MLNITNQSLGFFMNDAMQITIEIYSSKKKQSEPLSHKAMLFYFIPTWTVGIYIFLNCAWIK